MPEFDYSNLKDESSKTNEREVTDPITHLPLTIHDTDAVELEKIPPPPTAIQEKKLDAQRGSNSKEDTNARHVDMESVVREVLDANWWEDPIGDQRRARIQISLVAAGTATVGAFSMVVLWSYFGSPVGGQGSGVSLWSFISLLILCCALGLLVGLAGMSLRFLQNRTEYPDDRKPKEIDTQNRVCSHPSLS